MKRLFVLVLSLIITAPLLIGSGLSVHAADYDFSPTTSKYIADPNGVSKNGGAAYENCAYFTPTYFSKKGSIRAYVAGEGAKTDTVNLSYGSENTTYVRYYTSTARAGGTYYFYAKVTSISSGTSMRVKGRFTP